MKLCKDCGEEKPLKYFYKHKAGAQGRSTYCKTHTLLRSKKRYEEVKSDPYLWNIRLKQMNAASRRWKDSLSSEERTEMNSRHRQSVLSDRERFLRKIENQRINYRMKREQETGSLKVRSTRPKYIGIEKRDTIEGAELDIVMNHLRAYMNREECTINELAAIADSDERLYRRARDEGKMSWVAAEKFVRATDGHLVWLVNRQTAA